MTLALTPLHPLFGARVDGVDIASVDRRLIEDALGRYGLLMIPGAVVPDEALERFAARFGRLQNMSGKAGVTKHVIHVSNLAEDGSIKAADEASRLQHEANRLWHTDSSFLSPGASYSFLHAHRVTRTGGRTEYCDTRVAWEALPAERRAALAPLDADHSMRHSWRLTGVDMGRLAAGDLPTVRRALAPVHRPSGRRALMIPSHVCRIEGRDEHGSRGLLAELTALATAPGRIYAHVWTPGDLLIWDNRCMLHRVTPYDGMAEPRDLRSCRIIDDDDHSAVLAQAA